ncbi:hypothetical protein H257_16903 [Aphanomyces astaci]|uniref:Uncharacterized protein n=1 Tax=Aphanomyces astaci TaxID=112090 RepID=W4FIY4_APHAT|nr:hypothetical protein H257_16903 [Aphanomyces astaci]ETV66693.1 hypothetical protein H257_16903 [Aphanomyces astaci]|eukprot:XP_009843818.1 hypothetical protein H257_16903 [Aphanomyces astaci]
MASLPPDPGKHPTIPLTLSNTLTMPTTMATVIVHRNGVSTSIRVPATGIIRQHHPSSSENDSASDTTDSSVDLPLTARQLRSKRAADTFLVRHDRTRNPRSPSRPHHTHKPTRIHAPPGPARPAPPQMASPRMTDLSKLDRHARQTPPTTQVKLHHSSLVQLCHPLRFLLLFSPRSRPKVPLHRAPYRAYGVDPLQPPWRPIPSPSPFPLHTSLHPYQHALHTAMGLHRQPFLPFQHAATASSSKQTNSPANHAPPHEYTPYSHTQLSSPRPAPSDVQPSTTLASAPAPPCPAPATPPPTMTPPRVTLWTTTYPAHADYLNPSQIHTTRLPSPHPSGHPTP